mmetsp:Transcript_27739/g.31133  ORF Transcript_27739/g.31133 Transcript_27739/m.31133 type:complete len:748 (+) Transcript_27739:66-2309(+)
MVKRGGKRRHRQQLKEQQLQQEEKQQEQDLQKEQQRQIRTSSSDCYGDKNNAAIEKLESSDNTTNQDKKYDDNKRIDVTLIWNEKDAAITMNEEQTLLFSVWKEYLNNQNKKEMTSSLFSTSSLSNNWKPTSIQRQLWSILLNRNNDNNVNNNTVGVAPTGSGKTLSYTLPTLINIKNNNEDNDDIVVVVPTRELAHQVSIVYKKLIQIIQSQQKKHQQQQQESSNNDSKRRKRRQHVTVSIYGGVQREDQLAQIRIARLKNYPVVVVATPGRFLDLLRQEQHQEQQNGDGGDNNNFILPKHPSWIVLDEADQLTKDGDLGPQVQEILIRLTTDKLQNNNSVVAAADIASGNNNFVNITPDSKNVSISSARLVLVSATLNEKARLKFQEWAGKNYVLVKVDQQLIGQQQTDTTPRPYILSSSGAAILPVSLLSRIPLHLTQILHVCSEHKKPKKLLHTLKSIAEHNKSNNHGVRKGIIFYSRIGKLECSNKILQQQYGISCYSLHGQLPMDVRRKNMDRFASSSTGRRSHQHDDNTASAGRKEKDSLCLLLATDVAARGIDFQGIDFVIQYDFPSNLEQYIHRCGRAGRSRGNNNGGDGITTIATSAPSITEDWKFVIISFFTRNLQPLAADLIQLLEVSQAWVDPNLRSLLVETKGGNSGNKNKLKSKGTKFTSSESPIDKSTKVKKRKEKTNVISSIPKKQKIKNEDYEEDDDDFAELVGKANRIVLKRACHVSDASDDGEESDF